MTTKEILKETEEKMKKTVESTHREFGSVRTGRASPSLLEGIRVECYGTTMVLKQLANITTPDTKTVVVQPWDPSSLAEIEKAILKSDLGIMPVVDGKLVRVSIPQLTKERREELSKIVKKVAEDGKVSIRTARRDSNDHVVKLFKDKQIPEDARYSAVEDIQKLTDKYIKEIDDLLAKKEKEITEG